MAQIDREVGNQSGLGEAVNSYNHSLTFGKKKKKKKDPRSVHTLQQSKQCSGRGGEDRLREGRGRGIIKKSQSMEL